MQLYVMQKSIKISAMVKSFQNFQTFPSIYFRQTHCAFFPQSSLLYSNQKTDHATDAFGMEYAVCISPDILICEIVGQFFIKTIFAEEQVFFHNH